MTSSRAEGHVTTAAGEPNAEELRRASLGLAFATCLMSLIAGLGYRNNPGLGLWQDVQLACVSLAAVGLLLLQRKGPRIAACRAIFLTIIASTLVTITLNSHQLAQVGRPFLPLLGHKAALLLIGILAPGRWLGWLSIAAITMGGLLQTTMFPSEARLLAGEPLLTCVIAAVAGGLLVVRMRARAAERALAVSLAEATAAERLATIFLAIRDLSNTPLQTLELATRLLELRGEADADLVVRMKHSVDQLKRLKEVLIAEEERLPAGLRHLAGFDPWQELARRLGLER
jgi:hypothetical protein